MRTILLLFSFCICINLNGQLATDFTVTDYNGVSHALYADHLNQGQTVLIKLFFTSCPPCNNIAPQVETLYQQWGAGQYDVEFIELSTQGFDSNNDVQSYAAGHGLSFPGVGADGNASAGTLQFMDGTHGTFWGTPSYAVIAPDGTVNYFVGFSNINPAITATGATGMSNAPPVTTYDINLFRANGMPLDITGNQFILGDANDPSVSIDLAPHLTSDLQFSLPDAAIPMIANPVLEIKNNTLPMEGLTAIDVISLRKHILGLTPITSADALVAADVNDSGHLSALDIVPITKVIVGLNTTFNGKDIWEFYFDSCSGCQKIPLTESLGNTITLDTKVLKTGDVSGQ